MPPKVTNLCYCILFIWITHTSYIPTARADIFTSISKMKEIFFHEKQLLSGIKMALKTADVTPEAQDILRFCQERQEESKRENLKESVVDIKHPNHMYGLIKHFAAAYKGLRLAIEKMSVRVPYLDRILQDIPSGRDVQGASLSLLRLQRVYDLDPKSMADGNYSGHQGPALGVMDAFDLGLAAFGARKYGMSTQWFQITQAKQRAANKTFKIPTLEQVGILLRRSKIMEDPREVNKDVEDVGLSSLLRALNTDCSQQYKDKILGAEMKKVHTLCANMDTTRYRSTEHQLVCVYKAMPLPYYRVGEEILSTSPYVSMIYNITSPRESQAIQKLASRRLFRSEVQEVQGSNLSDYRTSHVAFLGETDSKHLSALSRRISHVTGLQCHAHPGGHRLQQSAGENYQVRVCEHMCCEQAGSVSNICSRQKRANVRNRSIVNYGIGGHYSVHLDTYEASYPESQDILKNSGNRIATVLVYLSKVETGGSTVFPWLDMAVPPIQHSALLWYNVDTSGTVDFRTRHAGCPVLVGDKWVMNKWILSHANTFQRPCGLDKTSNQRPMEAVVLG